MTHQTPNLILSSLSLFTAVIKAKFKLINFLVARFLSLSLSLSLSGSPAN